MKNIKGICLALAAMFALGAIAAGAAQAAGDAPRWTVEEGAGAVTLGAGAERKGSGTTTGALILATAALSLTTNTGGDCTVSGKIIGSAANNPGTFTGTLHCTEVTVQGATSKCEAHSPGQAAGTVVTNNVTGTLVWLEGGTGDAKVGALFKPDPPATAFVTIDIEPKPEKSCAVTQTGLEVKGEVLGEITEGLNGATAENPLTHDVLFGGLNCPGTPKVNYWNNATPRVEQTIPVANRLKLGAAAATITAHSNSLRVRNVADTAFTLWGIEPG